MLRTILRPLGPLLVAALAFATAACGGGDSAAKALPDTGATLEGTVKVGPDDIHFAQVIVHNSSGTASGKVGDDGKYEITNVPLGEVTVGVNTAAGMSEYQTAVMQAGAMTGGGDAGKAGKKKVNVQMVNVKEQYFDPDKSGLKTTVKVGPNTFNIELPASAKK